jgi:Uma2 family endonuclease
MATVSKQWTLEELHSLPDDGNRYELVRGELFVTPPPTEPHETLAARLHRLIDRYVEAHKLGYVYRPRAVMRHDRSEVEPDLMVRQPMHKPDATWDDAPIPVLVVEILSPTTRRRDQLQKRLLYMDAGVDEYWIVDPERNDITVVRDDRDDAVVRDELAWKPSDASAPFTLDVRQLFGDSGSRM